MFEQHQFKQSCLNLSGEEQCSSGKSNEGLNSADNILNENHPKNLADNENDYIENVNDNNMEHNGLIMEEDENNLINNINNEISKENNNEEEESFEYNNNSEFNILKNNDLTEANNGIEKKTSTDEIHFIKSNLIFLNHQLSMLMRAFSVQTCSCTHCNLIERSRRSSEKTTTNCIRINQCKEGSVENDLNLSPTTVNNQNIYENDKDSIKRRFNISKKFLENPRYLTQKRGRKSKYCSPLQKKAVAKFAHMHGASAAARKFDIPPAVAAYYYRKEFKTAHFTSGNNNESNNPSFFSKNSVSNNNSINNNYNKNNDLTATEINIEKKINNFSSNESGNINHLTSTSNELSTTTTSNTATSTAQTALSNSVLNSLTQSFNNGSLFNQDATLKFEETESNKSSSKSASPTRQSDMNSEFNEFDTNDALWNSLEKNATHSGSPGFLRGRGRGRPKLIGDELDAELVEYMVQLKTSNPRQHLTASQALHIARIYILEKAPGLLQEHGGQVKLKITWAMKLVSRIQEREREIQLGLPAGSLQNMGKTNLTNIPNGLMNELMAQNFFGQQNLKMLQSSMNESQTPTTSSSSIMSNENLFASSASNTAISSAKTISSIASMMTSTPSVASSMQVAGSSNDIKSNESQTFGTSTSTNSNAAAAASIAALLNKFSNEQVTPNTNYNTELFDPALLLAELGVGNVEELAQNELFKSLIQSMMTNRDDEFTSTAPTNLMQDSAQINNELFNALIAQNSGVKSSSQSNNRLSSADFVASAF